MVIYNITFVLVPERQQEFLDWMRSDAISRLFNNDSEAANPRLQTVVEAGGKKPDPEHGLSIALQAEFDTIVAAHGWNDTVLPPVLGDFTEKFGPHALYFATLLEVLPL